MRVLTSRWAPWVCIGIAAALLVALIFGGIFG